jgi:hypothetical protein
MRLLTTHEGLPRLSWGSVIAGVILSRTALREAPWHTLCDLAQAVSSVRLLRAHLARASL